MQISYKDTIRLPKTSFAMKANLKTLTSVLQQKWQNEDIYGELRQQNKGKPKFILHDGPPYANGNIHLGTALNKILKDIIVKGRSLLGFDAPLVFGWDCHGLPIEWKVEENYKKAGKNKEEIAIVEFRAECRKFAAKWLDIQREEFKKLGLIADFDNPYITMDYKAEALIYKEITKFIMDKSIYLGKKPVMWSVVEKTALAEAEVEYIDKISDAIYVGFKVVEASNVIWQDALAVIWTTTPWTIPANQAVAYGPEITYGLYQIKAVQEGSLLREGVKIIVADELAAKLFNEFLVDEYELLDSQKGLMDFKAEHPLYNTGFDKVVPLLPADYVDITVGTGLVHTAPSYGLDDFYLARKYKIIPLDVISDVGIYKDNIPLFKGQHIFKVNPSVIAELQKCNTLVYKSKIKHSYPCSWRSKAPLIYRLTSQWFLNLENNNLRQKVLTAIENDINFFPKAGRNRLYSMVKQRPDWCLSRQRLWGVPLAMFIHKDTEELLKDEETNNNIYQAFLVNGSDAWFKGDPKRFLSNKIKQEDYVAVFDVVDVWFDSGCTHAFVLRERKELQAPADIYIEGSDQHRGWFQSSLIESMGAFNEPPYKNIITHGFVLDEKGQKMSKSLGNVINPLEVIEKYGLDILRLWVASSDYQDDVRVGGSILKQQADVYRKIRNTLRYMLGNLTYFKETEKVNYNDLPELEKLVLHNVYTLQQSFKACFLENYEFHVFFNKLYNFITVDLSSFYFDIRKDCLYCDSNNDIKFRAALTVMDIVFNYVVKWLSPFISVTAEEAFLERYQSKKSILLETLVYTPADWYNNKLFEKYEYIKEVRKEVYALLEEARANKIIGSSLEAAPTVYVPKEHLKLLQSIDLATICITSGAVVAELKEPSIDPLKQKVLPKGTVEQLQNNSIHTNNQEDSKQNNNTIVNKIKIKVEFNKKQGSKCERCWKIEEVNLKGLCKRCQKVLHD